MKKFRYILAIIIPITGLMIYMTITERNINDLGLQFFQWVKKVKGDAVDLDKFNDTLTVPIDHLMWDQLLKKHVDRSGMVNYRGFQMKAGELDSYLNELSNNPPSDNWTREEKLVYWINAYNAFTVKLILDHYPVNSIKDIAGSLPMINSPWDLKFFKIGGVDFDLNTIEHEILRKQFDEPRIHFAINCASISCPELRKEAFIAERLEAQLDEQARLFINDTSRNLINDSEVKLSKIFNWFKTDFINSSSLQAYISKYSAIEIEPDSNIEFLDYNWRLNEAEE